MYEISIFGTSINLIEAFASAIGIIAIFFQVKQKILFWPLWILTALIYIYIFFISKLYALMVLQFYYVGISIYGWKQWIKGNKDDEGKIKNLSLKQMLYTVFSVTILTVIFYFLLKRYTDSNVPAWDGFVTAMSFVASWLLSHKFLQHWIMWIIADIVAAGVYFYKDLYPTTIFYLVLTVLATIGFIQWKKQIKTS